MFEHDDFPMEKNLVAKVMRYQIIDKYPLIVRLLGLDPSTPDDELRAEILRLCLFDRMQRYNPSKTFWDRLNKGDFLPVQPGEDPDNLPPARKPMTDDELDMAFADANADGVYWDGNSFATAIEIVRSVILAA